VFLQSRLPYFNIDNSKAKRAMAAIRSIGRPAGHRLARAGLFDSVNLNNTNATMNVRLFRVTILDDIYARGVFYAPARHLWAARHL
jgi:hypothetical protein